MFSVIVMLIGRKELFSRKNVQSSGFLCIIYLFLKSSHISMIVIYDSINEEFLYSMILHGLECVRA